MTVSTLSALRTVREHAPLTLTRCWRQHSQAWPSPMSRTATWGVNTSALGHVVEAAVVELVGNGHGRGWPIAVLG